MSRKTAVKQRQSAAGGAKKATRRRSGSAKSRPTGVRSGVHAKTLLPPEQPFDVEQGLALAAPAPPAKPAAARIHPSALCCIVAAAFERATTGAVRMQLKRRGALALVLLVPGPAWIEPVRKLFQLRFGNLWEVIAIDAWNNTPKHKEAKAVEIATHLARGRPVVGVASHGDALPATLIAAADLTIRVVAPNAGVIRRAIRMYAGEKPADDIDDGVASGLGFNDLVAAFRKNSSAAEIVERLGKASAALRGAGSAQRLPLLETAVEYGQARIWGLALARDIKDFKAGRIGWDAVDRGVVLYSEPGLGKSLFARILAEACGAPLVAFSIADLFAQGAGYLDSVIKNSRAMFEKAALLASPCSILFLDEIDALPNRATMSSRSSEWWNSVLTDFMLSLDNAVAGKRSGIVVISATNNIAGVDAALLRPGRLERAIEIARPDHAGILNVLRYHLDTSLTGTDLTEIGHLLAGSTPADIMMTVRDARRIARYANRALALDDLIRSVAPVEYIEPAALLRISTHEAGHAIGALAVPSGVLERCIVGGAANSAGRTMIAMETDDLLTKDAVERRAVALLCARAAEARLIGSIGLGSGGDETSDLALVTQLLATLHASTGLCGNLAYLVSYDDALQAVRADKALRARVEAHMRKLQARADKIVRRHRDAIVAVAERLRIRRHLSGDEIRRIFETTPPLPRTRAAGHRS
jgi:cell division protease FtsH